MDRFEQLKSKYAPALSKIQQLGVSLKNLHVQDDKLFIKGAAPSEQAKNEVWAAIKNVDATYKDLACDLTIDSSLPAPAGAQGGSRATPAPSHTIESPSGTQYTVRPGDTLSKISKLVYGDATKYAKIFEANRDQLSDPDKIKPGQVLKIPAA